MKEKILAFLKKIPKKPVIIIGSIILVVAIGIIVYFTAFYCDHQYKRNVTVYANCSRKGEIQFTCTKCGDTYKKTTDYDKGRHSYEKSVTKEATCTEDGVITYVCKDCGNSYTEPIKGGHKWKNATCAQPKTCSVCGATEGEKGNNHIFKDGVCTVCGLETNKTVVSSGVTFKIPSSEITLNYYDSTFAMRDVSIKYEVNTGGWSNFYVYYSGEQKKGNSEVGFDYSLKDAEGYVVASGFNYTPTLKVGEKTRDANFSISLNHTNGTDLRAGGVYTLSITQHNQ